MARSDRESTLDELKATLALIVEEDETTLKQLAQDPSSTLAGMQGEQRRNEAIRVLKESILVVEKEQEPWDHEYHSRDPLTGIIQSELEDNVLPELQTSGQGNPVTWIPAGVRAVLQRFRQPHPFLIATPASLISVPERCTIALLSDWGAPNVHAERLAEVAMSRNPDFLVHLGDIYFSGTEKECNNFISRWPLADESGPLKGRSLALNGNHEMYSLGIPFFEIVLPKFGQEASYFTLANTHWQLHGLDTAYQAFSFGQTAAANTPLRQQYEWVKSLITKNQAKRNIFLTHNQPVSTHLPEFQAAQPLADEARALEHETRGNAIYAWFFGHEHRCVIYKDDGNASFRARLIGNGSIPHHPQEETSPDRDETKAGCTPFLRVNKRTLVDQGQVAVSTCAILHLDGPSIHVEYLDEDGHVFYEEDWNAEVDVWREQEAAKKKPSQG